jgi:F-type H+-transporting ATPase subunit gamma
MSNTKQLRTQIKSLTSLQKILKALEVVSTIKLQKLKKKTETLRDFFIDFLNVLNVLEDQINIFDFDKQHWDEQWRRLIILISTDKWLCWSINSRLIKHVASKYSERKSKADIFVVGKKWLDYFVRDGRNIVWSLQLKDNFSEEELTPLYTYIKKSLSEKKYAKIKVYFNYFKTTITQVPLRFKIFPLDKESFAAFLKDIDIKLEKIKKTTTQALEIEPNKSALIQKIIQETIKYIVYSAVAQNKTWEHASRMLAMKNAKDNSWEIIRSINVLYNKVRQWKITQEISEIGNAKMAIEQN